MLETFSKEGEFRKSLTEMDWAWIAGIIDGEGHVAIRRAVARRGSKHWVWFSARLSVHNTHHDAMQLIARALCGNCVRRKLVPNTLPMYSVEISARTKLQYCVPKVLPYSKIKRDQLKLLAQFIQLPRGSGSEKERLWKQSKQLIGNPERSQWMKQAAGTCDGQSVPRIGMRLTSALRESDDMTCSAGKPVEEQSRRCSPAGAV